MAGSLIPQTPFPGPGEVVLVALMNLIPGIPTTIKIMLDPISMIKTCM